MDIDRIISIVRQLKEEGVASAPTMNLGAGGIAGTVEAGDNPPVKKGRKTYAKGGVNSRRWWLQHLQGR